MQWVGSTPISRQKKYRRRTRRLTFHSSDTRVVRNVEKRASSVSSLDDFTSGRGVVGTPVSQTGVEGSNPIRPHLTLAYTPSSRSICDDITDRHHSYVKSSDRGARAVDYLIYENNGGRLVGTIGFAFAGVRLPGELFAYYQTGQVRAGTPWVAKSRKIAV